MATVKNSKKKINSLSKKIKVAALKLKSMRAELKQMKDDEKSAKVNIKNKSPKSVKTSLTKKLSKRRGRPSKNNHR
jgi:hypothetical protein